MTDAGITLVDDWRTGQRCPSAKRRWLRRKVAAVDTVLVHATGVLGGFDVTRGQRAGAAYRSLGTAQPMVDNDPRATVAARLHRYRETPYHGVYSPRDRVSVVQWAATDFTYHGNKPNYCSLGWAYDGRFTDDESDELDIEGGRASLRHLINAALEQGCPLAKVTCHAQHSNKPHDPGPVLWLAIVEQVAIDFGLEIAVDWVTGSGAPRIKQWRAGATIEDLALGAEG